MRSLKYSIVPFEYYNPAWVATNGHDWWWVRIQTEEDDGIGWGVTQIGPYKRSAAEAYLENVAHPKQKGFWSRLFGK